MSDTNFDNFFNNDNIKNNNANDIKDALIYASIPNIINSTNFLNKDARNWNSDNQGNPVDTTTLDGFINFTTDINVTTSNRDEEMQQILKNTTLKRACCLKNEDRNNSNNYVVTVKLPYVDSQVSGTDLLKNTLYRKYGFMNKQISIPKSMCSLPDVSGYLGYDVKDGRTHPKCDDFYKLYCENVKHMYANVAKSLNQTYDSQFLHTYAPDCACFVDTPKSSTKVQPACYANSCLISGRNVYRDRETRNNGACTLNQCITIQNFDKIIADSGSSIDLSTPINQTCGSYAQEHGGENPHPTTILDKELDDALNGRNNKTTTTTTTNENTNNKKKLYLYIGLGSGILFLLIVICIVILLLVF